MGGYSDLCQLRECCVVAKTSRDFKAKGSGLFTPQQGLAHQGGDGSAHPAIVPLLSLTPPHVIEALNVLEPLSYCTRYLLESTNSTTYGAFYLHSGNTGVPCSLQAKSVVRGRPYSNKPCPLSQSRFLHISMIFCLTLMLHEKRLWNQIEVELESYKVSELLVLVSSYMKGDCNTNCTGLNWIIQ